MMEGLHRHIEYYPGQGIYGPGITTHGRGVWGPYSKTSGLLLLLGLMTLNILLLQAAGFRPSSLAGLATFEKRRFFQTPSAATALIGRNMIRAIECTSRPPGFSYPFPRDEGEFLLNPA